MILPYRDFEHGVFQPKAFTLFLISQDKGQQIFFLKSQIMLLWVTYPLLQPLNLAAMVGK